MERKEYLSGNFDINNRTVRENKFLFHNFWNKNSLSIVVF